MQHYKYTLVVELEKGWKVVEHKEDLVKACPKCLSDKKIALQRRWKILSWNLYKYEGSNRKSKVHK